MGQEPPLTRRQKLHLLLVDAHGSEEVHFQPPTGTAMNWPALVYGLDSAETEFADNLPYRQTKRYQVTVIQQENDFPQTIADLPSCTFENWFAKENLNHYVFTIYF